MGTGNRNVELGIGVEVTGTEEIDGLRKKLAEVSADTKALRDVQAAARSDLIAEKATAAERVDALKRYQLETDKSVRGSSEFIATERALKAAILDGQVAVRQKAEALAKATAAVKAASAAENALRRDLETAIATYRQVGSAATAAGEAQALANKKVSTGVQQINEQLTGLRTVAGLALGGSLIGGLAKEVGETADEFAGLQARIKLVTGEGAAFESTFQGVFDIAQRTGTAVSEVGGLFTKLAQAGKALNLSNADALALTESITQATQLSGASAESSTAAIVQFSQAIASGVLRGDELNSILEQAPRLARALAEGLGVTTGELRKMGEAGTLTATQVILALQGQSAALKREFDQLPPTIGRAITSLSNNWTAYIGQVDHASGASAGAAKIITALGENLKTVATIAGEAGKAFAALVAINLAKTFFDKANAINLAATAIGRETAAVATNTAAVVANTAAQRASVAATAAVAAENSAAALTIGSRVTQIGTSVAGVIGFVARLAGIASGIGAVVAIVSLLGDAFKGAGTWIGETAAKMLGAKDRSDDLAIALKGDAEAARISAQQNAALAQSLKIAQEKSLGLTDQSRKLIAEFTDTVTKGGEVSTALEKISKALELGNLDGIRNAGAALDALAIKGQISGAQVREALRDALKSDDLGVFATNARAAFDSSEQGARRLKAALDAVAEESLRRAGTSVDELKTGFTKATNSAINDLDTLAKALDQLGIKGADAARALNTSIGKALDTANTERAINAVIDRIQELGKQGKLSGEQVALGMDKAREKIAALLPGVQDLDEALNNFGLKSRAELKITADKLEQSWQRIKNSTSVSLAEQRKAFEQYAAAATAANKGIEPSAVAAARAELEIKEAALSAGEGIETGMRRGGVAIDEITAKFDKFGNAIRGVAKDAGNLSASLDAVNKANKSILTGNTYNADGLATDSSGQSINLGVAATDHPGMTFDKHSYDIAVENAWKSGSQNVVDPDRFWRVTEPLITVPAPAPKAAAPAPAPMSAPTAAPKPASSGTTTVNLQINKQPVTSVQVTSTTDAAAIENFLLQVAKAQQTASYP